MNEVVIRNWLDKQLGQRRELFLVIDRLAEPDPINVLFGADLMQDYVNLYMGTAYADLAEIGPWLIRLSDSNAPAIWELFENPERDWGWIGSVKHLDLQVLAMHWRQRLLIDENGEHSLYRFHDNRVLARSLEGLDEEEGLSLLGPIASVLYWNERRWDCFDNPIAENIALPPVRPWLRREPPSITREILRENLLQWVLQHHSAEAVALAEDQPVKPWLDMQLQLADRWQWHQPEQLQFLIIHRLRSPLTDESLWAPLSSEHPDKHFKRIQRLFINTEHSA